MISNFNFMDSEINNNSSDWIQGFLEEKKEIFVDLVERKITDDKIYMEIVHYLVNKLPLGENNQPRLDKAHEELATAIIHSMWCG